ncbi:hypothetical protein V6N12_037592 [Hibiscus sabdariffa]|uniref:RNase H type-1 domain-containing protein n=1 Tax=Hibiscus sabdariffa TaxID=183260 RepID=A0ABR2C2L9_9ROSI
MLGFETFSLGQSYGIFGWTGMQGSLWHMFLVQSETMGVYIGLMAVWDCGFRYVVLEVDNIEVYQAICAEQYTAKAGSLAWHIKTLMQGEWEVRVQHVLREGIGAADTLAKLAYKSSTSVIWFEEPPSIILHVLMKDVNCLD